MVDDKPEAIARNVTVAVPGAELVGTVWTPRHGARSVVLMLPGSGRATRDNDDLFPEVRDHLLRAGHATASFDKRGVASSTGNYFDNTIESQADDAIACADKLRGLVRKVPLGLFGHSQGGWVAFEAATRSDVAFVVSNSGPGVGPAVQERARRLQELAPADHADFTAVFDQLVAAAHESRPFGQIKELLRSIGAYEDIMNEYLQDGPSGWGLERSLLAYDPTAALSQLVAPTMVIHGALDQMVPVQASIAALSELDNAAISAVVLDDADHRLRTADGTLVGPYVETLTTFIDSALG